MIEPIVTVTQGQVKGIKTENFFGQEVFGFLGIPYAKAPTGNLRFKPPAKPEPWSGVLDGTVEGPCCPSSHMFFRYFCGAENNCLNLNVYTRKIPSDCVKSSNLKPVMVWIHGGAFMYGSNRAEFYGPKFLMMEDVVYVAINYRLGIFGFLCMENPALEVTGNMGLKDMVAALKWIQINIAAFNGDPQNVTIFGESAGSAACHYLLLSPLSKGLFHKAILQSGCALNCWARGKPNGRTTARYLNYHNQEDEAEILKHLLELPAHKLAKVQQSVPDPFTANFQRSYAPVIEASRPGAFLTEDPVLLMKEGRYHHMPIIIGYNSNEGLFFDGVRKVFPSIGFRGNFETEIPFDLGVAKNTAKSKEIAGRIKHFYYGDEEATKKNIDRLFLVKSDNHFTHGIHRTVNYQKSSSSTPIYVYKLTADTSLNFMKHISTTKHILTLFFCYFVMNKSGEGQFRNLFHKLAATISADSYSGVCHGDDLGYMFHSFLSPSHLETNSKELLAIQRVVRLWTNFAMCGNPTPRNDQLFGDNNAAKWQSFTNDEKHFLEIGTDTIVPAVNADEDRMEFWDSLYSEENCL